jgi:PAS domain S-box-containing protein
MERVLAGEAFDEVVVEVAPAGEEKPRWTHRIRTMVLTDAEGRPDCLALVLNDETERFDAEERFERAFAANPAPAVILRLSDLRYARVNRGFIEMTGYAEEDVVGRSIRELDVLEGAKQREVAMERLREHRTIPQMEAWPRLPDRSPKLVLVAGQPIEVGDDECMLFTFADLEPRRRAEVAHRQSETLFEKAFRLAPVPMAVADLEDWFRFILVNEALSTRWGMPKRRRSAAPPRSWALGRPRRGRRPRAPPARDEDGAGRRGAPPGRRGGVMDCLLSAEAVAIDGRPCALWAMQDVTERRRTEAELATAIEAVMRDTSWFSRTVLEKLAKLRRPDAAARRRWRGWPTSRRAAARCWGSSAGAWTTAPSPSASASPAPPSATTSTTCTGGQRPRPRRPRRLGARARLRRRGAGRPRQETAPLALTGQGRCGPHQAT